jgi:hypothetical protein
MLKPVVVDAVRWHSRNVRTMLDFLDADKMVYYVSSKHLQVRVNGNLQFVKIGEVVIKYADGSFSVCPYPVFVKTYVKLHRRGDHYVLIWNAVGASEHDLRVMCDMEDIKNGWRIKTTI